jgi:hypothetical protein
MLRSRVGVRGFAVLSLVAVALASCIFDDGSGYVGGGRRDTTKEQAEAGEEDTDTGTGSSSGSNGGLPDAGGGLG